MKNQVKEVRQNSIEVNLSGGRKPQGIASVPASSCRPCCRWLIQGDFMNICINLLQHGLRNALVTPKWGCKVKISVCVYNKDRKKNMKKIFALCHQPKGIDFVSPGAGEICEGSG